MPNASSARSSVLLVGYLADDHRLHVLGGLLGESRVAGVAGSRRIVRVNAVLERMHDDYVILRRRLADEGLLERSAGVDRRPSSTTG